MRGISIRVDLIWYEGVLLGHSFFLYMAVDSFDRMIHFGNSEFLLLIRLTDVAHRSSLAAPAGKRSTGAVDQRKASEEAFFCCKGQFALCKHSDCPIQQKPP
jgi:hypothetical protein